MSCDWKALFLEWIEELRAATPTQSNLQSNFKRAYKSLEAYNGDVLLAPQLANLQYIGTKTCRLLDKKQKLYCIANHIDYEQLAQQQQQQQEPQPVPAASAVPRPQPAAKTRAPRTWVPRYKSAAYALMVALARCGSQGGSKSTLVSLADRLCEEYGVGSSNHTWASMATLIKHGVGVCESRGKRNKTYFLTFEGQQLLDEINVAANELYQLESGAVPCARQPASADERLCWASSSYSVKLLIDRREVKSRKDRDFFVDTLNERGVLVDKRTLSVGDMLWVAQHHESGRECVLDCIVERKTIADLVQSIQEGRFFEQKQRLKKCARKVIFYLVEGSDRDILRYPPEVAQAVRTAITATLVSDMFHVKRCDNIKHTVSFLASVHAHLLERHSRGFLQVSCPTIDNPFSLLRAASCAVDYDIFQNAVAKTAMHCVSDVYLRILMAIRGVSFDKAYTIRSLFATPSLLHSALAREGPCLLFNLTCGMIARRRISKQLSRLVYEYWAQ